LLLLAVSLTLLWAAVARRAQHPLPPRTWTTCSSDAATGQHYSSRLLFVVVSSEFDTPLGSSGPASPAPSPTPDLDHLPDTGSIKEVGFYLLRKDSERRSTLVRIMTEDQDAVSTAAYYCCTVLTSVLCRSD